MPKGKQKGYEFYWSMVCSHKTYDNDEGTTHAAPGWIEKQRSGKNWAVPLEEFLETTDIDNGGRDYIKDTLEEIGQWDERREALRRFGIE